MPIAYHELTPLGVFVGAITTILACYIPVIVLLASSSPTFPSSQAANQAGISPTRQTNRHTRTPRSAAMDDTQQTTLNIPSLLIFAVLSFFAIRYFFFNPASGTGAGTSARAFPGRSRARPVSPEKIELVHSMFPQMDRRRIEWDLVRNGGSVQATTEKMLREGRLDEPPPNFRGQPSPSTTASGSGRASGHGPRTAGQPLAHQDLITRYNLSSRVTQQEAAAEAEKIEEKNKEKDGWSSSKTDRQALLKRRREEMVLNARRKMEERLKKEAQEKA